MAAISRRAPAPEAADDFIEADLTRPGEAERAFGVFTSRHSRLDVLINNAGIGAYAAWEELPEADWRRLMELNLFTPVTLTRLALGLLRRSRGCVINVASVAGLAAVPGMGAYSVAKFGLVAFSETLDAEVTRYGIHVVTVCPGRISTGFSLRAVALRDVPETPGSGSSSADGLARKVWRAARKRRHRVIYPGWYWWFVQFTRCFPRFYYRQAAKVWKLDA